MSGSIQDKALEQAAGQERFELSREPERVRQMERERQLEREQQLEREGQRQLG
jgi:hypothetical protein